VSSVLSNTGQDLLLPPSVLVDPNFTFEMLPLPSYVLQHVDMSCIKQSTHGVLSFSHLAHIRCCKPKSTQIHKAGQQHCHIVCQNNRRTNHNALLVMLCMVYRYDPTLECVITFTDDLAQQQAAAADALLAKGTYLGPLHGIPYGLKDLMAVPGYLTTWGAGSFKTQYLSQPAQVYTK